MTLKFTTSDALVDSLVHNFSYDGAGNAEFREGAADWLNENIAPRLAGAFNTGVAVAGRYGHEDNWDSDYSPYNDNPWEDENGDEE